MIIHGWPTSSCYSDERAVTVTAFTANGPPWFYESHGITAKRLMSDNVYCYTRNRSLRELLLAREASSIYARSALPSADEWEGGALPSDHG